MIAIVIGNTSGLSLGSLTVLGSLGICGDAHTVETTSRSSSMPRPATWYCRTAMFPGQSGARWGALRTYNSQGMGPAKRSSTSCM